MSPPNYPYSQGDRLSDRNTYFYSEFHGPAFLGAWHASRDAALAALPPPLPLPLSAASAVPDAAGYDAAQLLSSALEIPLLDRLLQRFEVSKRLYRKYDADLRAIRESGYDNLDLYLRFGALCLQGQSRAAPMRYLNALLKVIDSLISARTRLDAEQGAHLAWLIVEERSWLQHIAAGVGVGLQVGP